MIETYRILLNLPEAVFTEIAHEDAMVAIVYMITQPSGEKYILKICDRVNDYLREMYFLNFFKGKIPVPKIINHFPPKSEVHGAILMEFIEGSLLQIANVTEKLTHQLGSCLAEIHLNRLSGYGDPIQGDLNSDPKSYFTMKFEEGLDECSRQLSTKMLENCAQYFAAHVHLLNSVDGPCIVHRDFRPGNIIVHADELKGIIDWSGTRASFAEEDLASLTHAEWMNNAFIIKHFLTGYSTVRQVPPYTRLAPFLRLNKAVATLGFAIKKGTWNNKHVRIYQYNLQFLEKFFETNL